MARSPARSRSNSRSACPPLSCTRSATAWLPRSASVAAARPAAPTRHRQAAARRSAHQQGEQHGVGHRGVFRSRAEIANHLFAAAAHALRKASNVSDESSGRPRSCPKRGSDRLQQISSSAAPAAGCSSPPNNSAARWLGRARRACSSSGSEPRTPPRRRLPATRAVRAGGQHRGGLPCVQQQPQWLRRQQTRRDQVRPQAASRTARSTGRSTPCGRRSQRAVMSSVAVLAGARGLRLATPPREVDKGVRFVGTEQPVLFRLQWQLPRAKERNSSLMVGAASR